MAEFENDRIPTTKRHFELFKKECKKWQKAFGIFYWEFYFDHRDDLGDSESAVLYAVDGKQATFILSKTITFPVTDALVKRAAFHEVMELLLGPLSHLSESRFDVTQERLDQERHAVIRVWENFIFK